MAKDGLLVAACALVLTLHCSVATAGDPSDSVADRIAVQKALQLGRDLLARKNYEAAVQTLEGQIDRINGSREYLSTLRDAYREYVRELRLANRETEAQVYLRRLQYIDPGSNLDDSAARAKPAPAARAQAPPFPIVLPAKPGPVARGVMGDDGSAEIKAKQREAQSLLTEANQAFDQKQYDQAARLFEKANKADPTIAAAISERWAYCRVFQVVKRLNEETIAAPACNEMATEVRTALSLAPNNAGLRNWGTQVLTRIEDRLSGKAATGPTRESAALAAIEVRHVEKAYHGWYVAETTNFRIFHKQPRDLVDQVARSAENTKTEVEKKWFGGGVESWKPVCEIVLYATAADYSQQTQFPSNYPGHSKIESKGGQIQSRRIQLHCDVSNMVASVLPHETTHVVLAGKFGLKSLPRWADEGMAVQSEPRDQIERHLRSLAQYRQDRQIFSLRQLMQMDEYPSQRYLAAFYAQSVSLVDFLTQKRGPQVFAQFVNDGMNGGFEKALKQHYGYADFDELDQQWTKYAFTDAVNQGAFAERGR